MTQNAVQNITGEIAKVFYPFRSFSSQQQVTAFFRELGYELPAGQLFPALPNISAEFTQLKTALDKFMNASDEAAKLQAAKELLEAIKTIATEWRAALPAIKSAVNSVPGFIANSEIDDLPRRLIDYLCMDYFKQNHRRYFGILMLAGIFDEIEKPADAAKFQPKFILRKIHVERIPQYLKGPKEIPETVYQWETNFQSALLLTRLKEVITAYRLPGGIYKQSETTRNALNNVTPELDELRVPLFTSANLPDTFSQFGFIMTPAEQNGADKAGFAIIPFVTGTANFDFNVSKRFEIVFESSASIDAGIGIVIRPGSGIRLINNLFNAPEESGTIDLKLNLKEKEGIEELILFGEANKSRLAIKGMHIGFFANNTDVGGEAGIQSLKVAISGKDGDGFINKILDGKDISGEAAFKLALSKSKGFTFDGSGGFEINLPTHISFGIGAVEGLTIALKLKDGNVKIESGADIKFKLGPVTGIVNNIGISSTLSFPANGGNLAFANLEFGFKPPEGIGLSVDAGGFKGGGILNFDPDNHEYFGGLELDFKNLFALKAFAIINTRLPDGSEGFSMLIIITAEFNPIQLGFGFNLVGVGGLLGINRTAKVEVLKEGVKTGTLESILFPKDIVANINRIVSDIKQVFPPQENHFLICPMGKIGWGTPPIITLELGILIEIPATRLIILGILRALLPEEKKPVLKLQVNFLGIIDFENKSISFDASLYDSKILTFTLTGDMALRLNFGDNPSFLLSVGGFHPAFKEIPPDLQSMRRITISLYNSSDTRITIQTYFAVTSNTAQFGARAELFAEKGSFNIYGFVGYDVLFQFSPFKFIASLAAGVALRRNTSVIMSIDVSGELSGPTPWDAHGKASISFFFFSVSVPFHAQWGDPNTEGEKEKADILLLLSDAIQDSSNWKAGIPANNKLHVSIKDTTAEPDPVIHPFGVLTFSERIVPLDLDITKFGNQLPKDAKKFTIAAVGDFNGDDVKEPFAPASFFTMDDHEKLIRPSFEKLKSGFKITGTNQLKAPEHIANKQVSYEFSYLGETKKRVKDKFQYPGLFFTAHSKNSAAAQSSLSGINNKDSLNAPKKVNVLDDQYVLANVSDMKQFDIELKAGSYTETLQQYKNIIRKNPNLKDKLQVLSEYELSS